MSETSHIEDGKARKSWKSPGLRKIELSRRQREEVLALDDPATALKKLWPEIRSKQGRTG